MEEVAIDDGLRHSERKTRRALVQSTLFSCRSQEDGNCIEEEEQTEDDDGEEFGECKIKSKKRKRTTQPRVPRKSPIANTKAGGTKKGNSLVTVRSDFFVKVSERRLRQKQQREQQEMVALTVGNDGHDRDLESWSSKNNCQHLEEKANGNATLCKDIKVSDVKRVKRPTRRWKITDYKSNAANDLSTQSQNIPQTAFDLRLEAKMAAEEYAHLSAGRQTHPFFSSWKATRKLLEPMEVTETERKWCPVVLDDYPPVHVIEMPQDDIVSTDWKNWVICEKTSLDSNGYTDPENACLSVFEGSVEPLNVDSSVTVPSSHQTSFPQEVVYLDQFPDSGESMYVMSRIGPSVLADELEAHELLLTYLKAHEKTKSTSIGNAEDETLAKFRERMLSCKSRCCNQTSCSLWTNKYQPENASEICGNGESVRFLSEWLRSWHEKGPQTGKSSATGGGFDIQDSDSSYQNDSDVENTDERASLKNVLLVTGPVGSGKSAAVYACAKEQGFHVIEVNASDWRNGAHVKQKFGEAMESHGFNRWSSEEPVRSKRKSPMKYSTQSKHPASQESDCEVVEAISPTSIQGLEDVMEWSGSATENNITSSQGADKTLILFEDVDTIFDEDRGFVTTLLQLAETAKRPMILTSNSKEPALPQLLDRLVIDFTLPSSEELLSTLYMVCAAEKVKVPPCLIKQFIKCCQNDIRKTIMLLQFWCQGRSGQGDRKMQHMYSPLQFDLDAGHWVMPKVLPWGFPWELSTLVEREVSKALSLVKEEKQNTYEMFDALEMSSNRAGHIEAMKEAMLRRNCSVNDGAEFTAKFDVVGGFSDDPGSPVTFARRTMRHKLTAVLSSDSEDGRFCPNNVMAIPDIASQNPNSELLLGVSGGAPVQMLPLSHYIEPFTDQLCHSEGDKFSQNPCTSAETTSDPHICGTHKSVDVSCVPESSFVPETEVNIREGCLSIMVSSGYFPVSLEDVSLNDVKAIHCQSMADVNDPDKRVVESSNNYEPRVGNNLEADAESVHENEELEDSRNEDAVAATRGYPLMDECSCADFNLVCASVDNPTCPLVADLVQEKWRKLRGRREELKSHVTTEQKDASQIVKLASRLTDLISDSDVMLSCCQLLTSDSLDPMMVPLVEPDAICWHDEQVYITSTFAQHGLCLYAKKTATMGSNLDCENKLDLAQEMLTCSTNTMALGKLVAQGMDMSQNSSKMLFEPRQIEMSSQCVVPRLFSTVLSTVPARSCLALKGAVLHEYLSSLSQMSKSEASRLLKSAEMGKQRRRAQVTRHYLSSGSFTLCPEEMKLLAQYGSYGKAAEIGSMLDKI